MPNIGSTSPVCWETLWLQFLHDEANVLLSNTLYVYIYAPDYIGWPSAHLVGQEIRAGILVQVTINRRLLIGRDGHLDQSEAYDLS